MCNCPSNNRCIQSTVIRRQSFIPYRWYHFMARVTGVALIYDYAVDIHIVFKNEQITCADPANSGRWGS